MDRRSLFKLGALLGLDRVISSTPASALSSAQAEAAHPIVLYCDLGVDPAREQEMLSAFHDKFKPAAEKFDGYIDVKMLKIVSVLSGQPAPPPNINYRFQLTFVSEARRQAWIHSAIHRSVWPLVEATVPDKHYLTILTEVR